MATKGASKPLLILAASSTLLTGLGGYVWHESHRPAVLEVYVFDLPGVPGIFIRTPADKRILINGGSNSEIIRHLTKILPFYSRRIDTIIATEPTGKNVTGLIDVLNRYKADRVFGLASSTDTIYRAFVEAVVKTGLELKALQKGDVLDLDDKVFTKVIFPVPADQFEYSKASGPEILIEISYGSNSILLAGHASTKVQKFLAKEEGIGHVDALVVSHSALSTNMAREFMASTSPDFLVYSKQITQSGSSKKAADTKKKVKADPLAGLRDDQRFNIRETGVVKIISDGTSIHITQKI